MTNKGKTGFPTARKTGYVRAPSVKSGDLKLRNIFAGGLFLALLAGCQTTTQESATSQCKGSLSDYSVPSCAYTAAYDSGFSNPSDRMGWSQPLQIAWSRGAAAEHCGLKFDRDAYLDKLARNFPETGHLIHDLNGLQWHGAQIQKAGQAFCTDARLADARQHL